MPGAAQYVGAARAPNTKNAYRTDWAEFTAWADQRGLATMPAAPATVALYLTDLARVAKTSTVERRLASIAFAHRTAGHPSASDDPTVKAVWAGIRRVHGTAENQATPITVPLLRRMIAALPAGPAGLRDAALLLVGFAGALRRSELVLLTSPTSKNAAKASSLPSAARRPIKKRPGGRSESPCGSNRPRVPSAIFGLG